MTIVMTPNTHAASSASSIFPATRAMVTVRPITAPPRALGPRPAPKKMNVCIVASTAISGAAIVHVARIALPRDARTAVHTQTTTASASTIAAGPGRHGIHAAAATIATSPWSRYKPARPAHRAPASAAKGASTARSTHPIGAGVKPAATTRAPSAMDALWRRTGG